jgi:hypothetical protein
LDNDPFVKVIDEGELSDKSREMRDKAWEVIKELAVLEPIIFDKKERRKFVLKASSIYNLHEKTVLSYLKRFWKREIPGLKHKTGLSRREIGKACNC